MKVLIIDDFEMIRIMIKGQLTAMGIKKIDQAQDGKLALETLLNSLIAKDPYNIIFCDWNMPNMTGIEVLKFCKSHEELKNIPFVMVTAESEKSQVLTALKSGAADYLVKPIAPAILQKKVQFLIEKFNLKTVV